MNTVKTLFRKATTCDICHDDNKIEIILIGVYERKEYTLDISHLDKVLSYKQVSALLKYAEKNQIQETETEQTLSDSETVCPSQSEAIKVAETDTLSNELQIVEDEKGMGYVVEEKPFPNLEFRLIVAGSRTFTDYALLESYCDKMLINKQDHEITILSGGAKGADTLANQYAVCRGYDFELYSADWDNYGKKAGYIRNIEMAKNADALIAFDGGTKGIGHMIDIARARRLPTRIKKV